jgi:hypothetical protein
MKANHVKEKPGKKKINWALPDQAISQDEFRAAIKEAEQGPFMNVDEFDQRFDELKHKKGL